MAGQGTPLSRGDIRQLCREVEAGENDDRREFFETAFEPKKMSHCCHSPFEGQKPVSLPGAWQPGCAKRNGTAGW